MADGMWKTECCDRSFGGGRGTRVIHLLRSLVALVAIDMLWNVPKINSPPGVGTDRCYVKFWRHLISLQTAAPCSILNRVLWWKVLCYLSAPQENNCLQIGTAADGHSFKFDGPPMQELKVDIQAVPAPLLNAFNEVLLKWKGQLNES